MTSPLFYFQWKEVLWKVSDMMRLLITADLNQGLSVGAINKAIKSIEKNPSLRAIRLKVDVDQSILKTLKEFNRSISMVNQSMGQQSNINRNLAASSNQSTQAIDRETQALNRQNEALEKNEKLKTRVVTSTNKQGGQNIKTDVTTGNGIRNRTESSTLMYDSDGSFAGKVENPTIETFNHNKLREAEENLKQFTDKSNQRLKELRKSIGNLNPDINRLSKELKTLDVNSSKHDFSKVDDQIKTLESFAKQEIKARKEVDDAVRSIGKRASQEEINDINKRAELSQKARLAEYEQQMKLTRSRIQDVDRAEFEAYRQKERLESNLHGKRIQDQKRAYDAALVEDAKFNAKRLDNENKFSRMQQDSLNKLAMAQQKFGHHKKVRKELENIKPQIESMTISTKNWDNGFKNLNTQIAKSTAGFKAMRQESMNFGQSFKTAMEKFPVWVAAATAFYAPIRGMQTAIGLIYEVDSQMTQLKRVMDDSTDYEGMLKRSIELTKELGQSITTINNSMIEFARQGFDEQQTMALAKTATLAQNISELTSKEAVDAITAAMIIWNIEADKSITIVDKLNNIDNNFSVTTQNLAIAMQKASATAKNFGVELNTLLGHSTAIMAATRESGSVVGNSLRTIYSRITTMSTAETALQNIGISIRDLSGDMRPVQDILTDLQAKWASLNDEQKQNTSFVLAGRYQLNRFTSLMENWQMGLEATETAMHSTNSAINENAKYLESLEARTNRMKAAWQEFALTMGDAVINNALISLINLGTGLAQVLSKLVNTFGFFPTTLFAVGVALGLLNAGVKTFAISILNAIRTASGLPPVLMSSATAANILTGALSGVKIALRSLLVSTGVGLALAGLGYAAEFLINKFGGAKDSIDEVTESLTTMDARIAEAQRLETLAEQYEKLADKTALSTEEKIKLSQIEQTLLGSYDLSLVALDGSNEAYRLNNELIEQKIRLLKEEIATEREKASLAFRSDESNIRSNIDDEQNRLKEAEIAFKKAKDAQDAFIKARDSGQVIKGKFSNLVSYEIDPNSKSFESAALRVSQHLAKDLKEAQEEFQSASNSYQQEINKATQGIRGEFRSYLDALEVGGSEISPATRSVFDALAQLDAEHNLKIDTNDLNDFFTLVNNNIISVEDIDKLLSEKFPDSANKSGLALKSIRDHLIRLDFQTPAEDAETLNEELGDTSDKIEEAAKSFDDATSNIKALNKVIYELSEGQSISAEETANLIKLYPELADKITKTTDGWIIENEALQNVKDAQLKLADTYALAQEGISKSVYDSLQNRLDYYGIELDAIQSVADAQVAVDKMLSGVGEHSLFIPEGTVAAIQKVKEIAQIRENFNKLYTDPSFGVSKTKKGSSEEKDKDKPKKQDDTDARINAINKEADAQNKRNAVLKDSISTDETYGKQIEKTRNLSSGQLKEINLLAKANADLLEEQMKLQNANKNYKMSTWIDANGEATESFIKLYNSMKSGSAQSTLQSLFDQYVKYDSAIKENKKSISSLVKENKELLISLDEIRLANTQNYLSKRNEELAKYDLELKKSQQRQSIMIQDGANWTKEQERQIKLMYDKRAALKAENDWIRMRIEQDKKAQASEKLTKDQMKLLTDQLQANSDAWYDNEVAIISATKALDDNRERAADKIIADYKKMLEQQRDLEMDAVEERIKAEDERHDNVMNNYKKERDAFKEIIDAQRKALDRQNSTEDYDREIQKLLNEEQKIQTKLNTASQDNSYEGKAKRKDLEEQLREIQEQIQDKQRERERELQRNTLDDLLEDREKHLDNLERIEDEKHKNEKNALEKQKEESKRHYDSLLNDEKKFYEIKQNLLSQDSLIIQTQLAELRGDYDAFFNYLISRAETLGKLFSTINSNTQIDYDNLNKGIPNPAPTTGYNTDKAKDWSEYLQNKKRAEEIRTPTNPEFQKLRARNDELRAKWGFKDGSYNELKDIEVRHKGGEVGASGSTAEKWLGETLKSNEVRAILEKGEVVLNDPLHAIREIASKVRNSIGNVVQKAIPTPSTSSGTVIENISVVLQGNVQDGSDFAKKLMSGLSNKGIRLGR